MTHIASFSMKPYVKETLRRLKLECNRDMSEILEILILDFNWKGKKLCETHPEIPKLEVWRELIRRLKFMRLDEKELFKCPLCGEASE